MLVEFIGCTGSGKTTLCRRVVEGLRARGVPARLLHTGAARFDLVALPGFLRVAARQPALCALAARVLARDADSVPAALNLGRHFARKMGIGERLRRHPAPGAVVWEEGLLHAAHHLFVHVRRPPRPAEVEAFARAVPKPDLAVYIRAPVEVIVGRLLARGHRRLGEPARQARAFTEHAWETFETLAAVAEVGARLLTVDNDVEGEAALARLAEHITDRLAGALGPRAAWAPRGARG